MLIQPVVALSDSESEQKSTEEENYYFVCTADGEYKIHEKPAACPSPKETTPKVVAGGKTPPTKMRRIKGGFIFPISEGGEVERLERSVLEHPDVRQEYVRIYACSIS